MRIGANKQKSPQPAFEPGQLFVISTFRNRGNSRSRPVERVFLLFLMLIVEELNFAPDKAINGFTPKKHFLRYDPWASGWLGRVTHDKAESIEATIARDVNFKSLFGYVLPASLSEAKEEILSRHTVNTEIPQRP